MATGRGGHGLGPNDLSAMTDAFSGTLHLERVPSRSQWALVVSLHGLAIVILGLLAASRPLLAFLIPIVIAFGWNAVAKARLRTGGSIRRLRWAADERWAWQSQDREWHEGRLVSAATFGTVLVVLGLSETGGRKTRLRYCACFHDGLSADAHRQLRARLTVRSPDGAAAHD